MKGSTKGGLCLSRKLNESIVIGEASNRIVITVTDIDRGKIRLRLEADRSIPIMRSELLPLKQPKATSPAA